MKEVALGVIGLGNMGTSHARNLVAGDVLGARLAAVADRNVAVRGEEYLEVAKFKTGEGLIESGVVDAVVIATPHFSHTSLGIASLNAGLHTLVEKPISVHKADAGRLIAARKDEEQIFAAMFNQRTDPYYRKIKELVDTGELGEIQRINWIMTTWYRTDAYYESGGWRATWRGEGGGVLMNQCPHQLDLLQWIFGMPSKVRAFCRLGQYHDIEVEDDVTAYLEYKNGASGVFVTTTGESPGTNRLEVVGERGKLVYENDTLSFVRNRESAREFRRTSESGFAQPEVLNVELPQPEGHGGQHLEILQNFVDCIRDSKTTLLSPAEEGIYSVELANTMLFSSLTEETIELPLDGEAYERKLHQLIAESKPKKTTSRKKGPATDFGSSFK